jgi:hypothetical protein
VEEFSLIAGGYVILRITFKNIIVQFVIGLLYGGLLVFVLQWFGLIVVVDFQVGLVLSSICVVLHARLLNSIVIERYGNLIDVVNVSIMRELNGDIVIEFHGSNNNCIIL